jgi:hypothetical protein
MLRISGSPFAQRTAMRKFFPALNGNFEHKESYGKGYLPDSPSVLS